MQNDSNANPHAQANEQIQPQNDQNPNIQYQKGQFQKGQYNPGTNYQQIRQKEQLVDGPCTFNKTANRQVNQRFYNCITCGLVDSLGCCEACSRVCHAGHQLVSRGNMPCFCDCGEGSVQSCVRCK